MAIQLPRCKKIHQTISLRVSDWITKWLRRWTKSTNRANQINLIAQPARNFLSNFFTWTVICSTFASNLRMHTQWTRPMVTTLMDLLNEPLSFDPVDLVALWSRISFSLNTIDDRIKYTQCTKTITAWTLNNLAENFHFFYDFFRRACTGKNSEQWCLF